MVTLVPAHILLVFAAMLTLGVTLTVTTSVMLLLVATVIV